MSGPPSWLKSRWTIVPGSMALGVLAWNLHVAAQANGIVEGMVVDASGRPVAAATVVLFDRGFVTHAERARATAGPDGRFRFAGNANHSLQLEAQAEGLGKSERRIVRLWFRAQDVRLAEPLRLAGARP